jgi:alginate biosynthesis protein AlgK
MKWLAGLALWVIATTAAAGLPAIRYQLAAQPGIFWDLSPEAGELKAGLRELAEFGLGDAQLLLASQLSMSSGFVHLREAIHWYQKAYDNGHDDAPGFIARIVEKKPLLHEGLLPYLREVASRLSPEQGFKSVWSLLEIYSSYPDFAEPARADRLLELYRRACINTCFPDLFAAKTAELNGRDTDALHFYRLAGLTSGRGVNAYFEFLERFDDRESRFQAFADSLYEEADTLTADVVQGISGTLRALRSEFNPTVIAWLDLAVEKGATNAPINRIEYMLDLPDSFSFQETRDQIKAVEVDFPIQSKLLRAQLLTTLAWKKLDPHAAYDLLKGLEDRNVSAAHIGMGDLYHMGGLDEVDQLQAIAEYKKAAQKGYGTAFHKIAAIYRYGRAICNDKVQSHAYSRMALMLGEGSADEFLRSLKDELDAAEVARANAVYRELLAAYPVEGFE